MDDPLLVRGRECLGDLPSDRQRVCERNRSARDPIRQRVALNQLHDECEDTVRLFETVDVRDVRMVQRGEDFSFPLESDKPVRITRDRRRQHL